MSTVVSIVAKGAILVGPGEGELTPVVVMLNPDGSEICCLKADVIDGFLDGVRANALAACRQAEALRAAPQADRALYAQPAEGRA